MKRLRGFRVRSWRVVFSCPKIAASIVFAPSTVYLIHVARPSHKFVYLLLNLMTFAPTLQPSSSPSSTEGSKRSSRIPYDAP
ncbi:hypothetical protein PHLGIDRAFT_407959 [Phlebiopsis gigantea 11061_1 CR5-6]|uniref:Uncharacterized protein n=1 Tax=Phlebiopsis gigantea (strain 11061_1 CR5-6) TaxID=745531 RepID=A0A0C3NRC2_PHLG1|nr:hypothetical protein PHLGIDRAFT_407959 [Phlebiopsis gigantea 11061_1 CR5-6]